MANPMILFYNLDNEKGKKLKYLCLKHKIKIRNVEKTQYSTPIGNLAGLPVPSVVPEASDDQDSDMNPSGSHEAATAMPQQDFTDEMLVFCGFTGQLLDTFLLEFKKNRIPRIALKAVLTEQNLLWNSYVLHDELAKEHQMMTEGQQ